MATKTKLVTYDDYRNLPNDGKRYEIIGGELFMTPAPGTVYQRISHKILVQINNYVEKHNLGEFFDAPIDVVLSMTDLVQPDLVYISKEREQIVTKKNIVEAPDLVVEILSENTKTVDRNRKKDLYEKYNVKEYWIVDPAEMQVDQFVLQNEQFVLRSKLEKSDTLTSNVIEDLSMNLDKIFVS